MIRFVVDPNVLVSGLITIGPPAEVVDLIRSGQARLVACAKLFEELEGVLLRPKFRQYADPSEVASYIHTLRILAETQDDPTDLESAECRDPGDAYLVVLARTHHVDALVSGDRDLLDLDGAGVPVLPPREALDRFDPVPHVPFQAVRGTFHVILSGPKIKERRIHRLLQAAGFVTQRTSGIEQDARVAWVEGLAHSGEDLPAGEFQQERLATAQTIGAADGYRLRIHGIVTGGPTEFRVVRHRASGAELFRLVASDPTAVLARLSEQMGLPRDELILEDAPGTWDLPSNR